MTAGRDFWSRRKAGVAAEAEAEARVAAESRAAAEAAEHEAATAEKTDAEILAELNLPDPDTLERGDDFSAFLARAVPERIRQRALRRLWRSDPVLANLDALLEYGEDYTDKATVPGVVATAWKLGRGYVTDTAGNAEAAPEAEPGPEPDEPPVSAETAGTAEPASEDTAAAEPALAAEADAPRPLPRRHMQFHFPQESATS